MNLANARHITVDRLFSPFWDTIAIEAVKDLLSRPQITQSVADLLGISVSDFLILTQSSTLPFLVLTDNVEVINRISQARQGTETWLICQEAQNLNKILALLLQQNVPDVEASIMSHLRAVHPQFEEQDISDLMRIEPTYTALHLLVAAGAADEGRKSRVEPLN